MSVKARIVCNIMGLEAVPLHSDVHGGEPFLDWLHRTAILQKHLHVCQCSKRIMINCSDLSVSVSVSLSVVIRPNRIIT